MKSSNLTQNVVLVLIKESVEYIDLDTVVEQVQTVAVASNANTLMALTGNEGTSGTALLNLQQTSSRSLQNKTVGDDPNYTGVMMMLTPAVLSALLIVAFILAILIYGFLQLLYVQTPEVFVATSIDFGKIEK